MWSRESIKKYAKDFLRKHYWKAFLVCFIAVLIGNNSGNSSSVRVSKEYNWSQTINKSKNEIALETNNPILRFSIEKLGRNSIFYISKRLAMIIIVFFVIILITIGYALEVGKNRFFLRGFKDDVIYLLMKP